MIYYILKEVFVPILAFINYQKGEKENAKKNHKKSIVCFVGFDDDYGNVFHDFL